ncbi:MAG: MoaD/ThiS family protein [Acidimicrobiia bacterium]
MKILLRNPRRELEMPGPLTVAALLQRLELNPESVLVIVGEELVTHDARLEDAAHVEIRPVISGGAVAATEGSSPSERTPARRVSRRGERRLCRPLPQEPALAAATNGVAESERGRLEIRPVISGGARP